MCTKPDRANRVPCPTTARQRLIATHHDSIVRLADGRVVGEDCGSGLPPIRYTRGSGSRRRSSVTRYGCITSSCSACVTCRNCCSNGASSSPTRQSGPGANGSDPIRAAGTDGLVLPVLARGGGAGWVVRHCPAGGRMYRRSCCWHRWCCSPSRWGGHRRKRMHAVPAIRRRILAVLVRILIHSGPLRSPGALTPRVQRPDRFPRANTSSPRHDPAPGCSSAERAASDPTPASHDDGYLLSRSSPPCATASGSTQPACSVYSPGRLASRCVRLRPPERTSRREGSRPAIQGARGRPARRPRRRR
jgi:hypothetical protein